MVFRECRLVTLYELINYACGGMVDIEKVFLMLGGLRNGIYYFKLDHMNVIGTGGVEEINCPGIFDDLHIIYDKIQPQQFVKMLDKHEIDMQNYFYIIPVLPELLNKGVKDLNKIGTFGQSFFMIENIQDGKINFKFDIDKVYLDIDVLRILNVDEKWVIESEFNIYQINKLELKENSYLHKLGEKHKNELLHSSLIRFTQSCRMEGTYGTVRIDGPEVYELVHKYFDNMAQFMIKLEDEKKQHAFKKNIYIQCLHFRKFLLSGTDAYYRNEFHYILNQMYKDDERFTSHLKKWEVLEELWRNFGRKLSKYCTYKVIMENPEICLNCIIDFWEKIGDIELDVIKECRMLLENRM